MGEPECYGDVVVAPSEVDWDGPLKSKKQGGTAVIVGCISEPRESQEDQIGVKWMSSNR